jgi:hypothetical protein
MRTNFPSHGQQRTAVFYIGFFIFRAQRLNRLGFAQALRLIVDPIRVRLNFMQFARLFRPYAGRQTYIVDAYKIAFGTHIPWTGFVIQPRFLMLVVHCTSKPNWT